MSTVDVVDKPQMSVAVPKYLDRVPESDRYYGTLEFDELTRTWEIRGEPAVVEMAKRLFPGCSGRGAGIARFNANKRTNGDLNWLMMRFPLEIVDREQWERSFEETVEHVIKREEIYRSPERAKALRLNAQLTPFQEEGLAFLLHNRRALLADDMGLGKTVQALAFLATAEAYPALVVVQPHLITNFHNEIKRFLEPPLPDGSNIPLFGDLVDMTSAVHIIRGRKPYELPEASIYIIHYGLLASWHQELERIGIETIIFDEIQDLRHSGTLKYSAASLLSSHAPNVIGLSGTPIYNHGGEIWNVMNIIDFHCLGDWEAFTREWCDGYGREIIQNPELLGDYLRREGLMLRRRKEEVLSELPPKRRVVQYVDYDEAKYNSLIHSAVVQAMKLDGVKDVLERGRIMREVVNSDRQATGIAKAPYVAQFVRMLLDSGERVLLFAHHHAVFDIYMELLQDYGPRRISGRETAKEKDESVSKFMNGTTNLLLISLRSSAGLNLQRGNIVCFGELDWSPAIHSQAEDRAHRMGQIDSVLAYYFVSEGTSDDDVQEALGLKIAQFVGLMGDHAETEEDRMLHQRVATEHMNKIVERIKMRGKAS